MGLFSGLKKIFIGEEDKTNSSGNLQKNDIPIQIARMRQRVVTVEQIYPNEAKKITELLNNFEKKLQDVDMSDSKSILALENEFEEIRETFIVFYKKSREKFALNEAEGLTKRAEDLLFGNVVSEHMNEDVDNEIKYLNSLKERVTSFDGIKQQAYIAELMKAEFRIKCLRAISLKSNSDITSIKKSSRAEKIIYANILIEDIKKLEEQLSYISTMYKINDLPFENESHLQTGIDELNMEMTTRYIGNFSLDSFFDNEDSIKKYLDIIRRIANYKRTLESDIKENLEIKKAEEETKKENERREEERRIAEEKKREEERLKKEKDEKEKGERLKRYKTIDEREMRTEIKRIDDETADITTSFINIMKYEMEVGESKGILNKKNMMQRDDLIFYRIKRGDVLFILKRAEELGQRCIAFMDVDDFRDSNCIIACSNKCDPEKLFRKLELKKTNPSGYHYLYELFDISNSFAYILEININENNEELFCAYNKLYYNANRIYESTAKKKVKSWIKAIQNTKTADNDIRDIPFYIEISYLRPMLPILEQLSANDIEFYIPPIDKKTNKYNAKKKIYIDRQYLQKYKGFVHNQISDPAKGIVKIGLDNLTFSELVLTECDLSSLDLEQQK